ncbi:MAG: 50S ribosomal protein L29 [Chloroflexi bacterium]|nr:50S ribosomal protein L29 [Chloroflexota bacterium]
MDIDSIRGLSDDELYDELEDQKEAYFKLRFQRAFGQLEDLNSLRISKRTIARIKTVIREREIAAQQVEVQAEANDAE